MGSVTTATERPERRADALSKKRIVDAAVEILDIDGERALTFRALAGRLATGAGAIYWHVADKDELLAATTDAVVARTLGGALGDTGPREAVRVIALAVFDAIDAHPWVGAQLSQQPWQPAVLRIFERFGSQLRALGVPEGRQFYCASALLNYVSGLAGQYAAGARLAHQMSRPAYLERIAVQWTQLDPGAYPFVRRIAPQLADHDDREQFLAGIDLILAGIDTLRPADPAA